MSSIRSFLLNRLVFVIPQLFGILMIAFFLVKTIPGDPAVLMLGPNATDASVAALRTKLGLDQSVVQQFWIFVTNLAKGDLGTSWQTTRPVLEDLFQRFPATLELVTFGLLSAILIGIPMGLASALKLGIWGKISNTYGLIVGALPDFWLGLVMIFVFYTLLQWAPAPFGRIDMIVIPPATVTGSMVLDSLIAGNWEALVSALQHLLLPALTLGIVASGPIQRMTQSMVESTLDAGFSRYQVISGLPTQMVVKNALKNALPSIITIISVLYGYLLGGAVLVETVFSWGGAGQYAVQGVLNSDIFPVLGFVLFASIFSLLVYFIVDVLYFLIDPRAGS